MHLIVWEFEVPAGNKTEFERCYGKDGERVELFERFLQYEGTSLLKKTGGGYITIDFWESAESFDAFVASAHDRYEEIDRECARLTTSERHLGRFSFDDCRCTAGA